MKIIITADIHNGVPNKDDDCIWSMRVIRNYAHENNIDTVLVLGDLFHDRVNLNIKVLHGVYSFFEETDDKFEQQWVCFPGNHDMFLKNSWDINPLRPLNRLITVIEDISSITLGGVKFWILPFIHYETAYMSVLKKLEDQCEEGDILLTHVGVNGASLNACFLLKYWDIVTFSKSPFHRVYAGHFHCHQQVGEKVWYPGSPIPFKFDEGLVEHGFFVFDTETRDHEFIPTFGSASEDEQKSRPPDFVTINDDDMDNLDFSSGNKVRVALDREHTENELSEIRKKLMENGAISVSFTKPSEKDEEVLESTSGVSVDDSFDMWVEHDEPKNMNKNLLFKLNDQVKQEAQEQLVTEDIDD